MKIVPMLSAVLLAIPLFVFGGNFFVNVFELPPGDGSVGADLLQSMYDGGLMGAIAFSHVVIAILLVVPRTRFLGALLQLPMSIGIVSFHATMLPAGLGVAVAMLVLNLGALAEPGRWRALLAPRRGSGRR